MAKIKITQIFDDAKDKNVAKTVLYYDSADSEKVLYYEPTLENEVAKKDLVDFFLKGLVIQAVTEGVPTGEYEMPVSSDGKAAAGGSGMSVIPIMQYGADLKPYIYNDPDFIIMSPEDASSVMTDEYVASRLGEEITYDIMRKLLSTAGRIVLFTGTDMYELNKAYIYHGVLTVYFSNGDSTIKTLAFSIN